MRRARLLLLPFVVSGCNALVDVGDYRFVDHTVAANASDGVVASVPDLALWLDAWSLEPGTAVSAWPDTRGAGLVATQGAASRMPLVVAEPRMAVVLDGDDDYLVLDWNPAGPLTFFVVAHHDVADLTSGCSKEADPVFACKNSPAGHAGFALTTRNTYFTDPSLRLRADIGNGTTLAHLAKNGIDVAAPTGSGEALDAAHAFVATLVLVGEPNGGAFHLGAFPNTVGSRCYDGRSRISEVVAYARELDAGEEDAVTASLMAKWAIE